MKSQSNTTQMKEQTRKHRSPNKWRGNRQTTWKRILIMIVEMIVEIISNNDSRDDQKPWKQKEKTQESNNKALGNLKNKHTETNNTITEIKNSLKGINSRISESEEWLNELVE